MTALDAPDERSVPVGLNDRMLCRLDPEQGRSRIGLRVVLK